MVSISIYSLLDLGLKKSLKSSIVFDTSNNMFNSYKLICEKYVENSSEHAINVSGMCRENLLDYSVKEKFDNLNEIERITIFDDAIGELFTGMTDTYDRFVKTKEFTKITQIKIEN